MATTHRSNSLLAFFIGGLIGAGLALLYAPSSGADTRRRIREGMEDAGDWARERAEETKMRVNEGAGRVRQLITDQKENIRSAYEAGKEAYIKGKESLERESV